MSAEPGRRPATPSSAPAPAPAVAPGTGLTLLAGAGEPGAGGTAPGGMVCEGDICLVPADDGAPAGPTPR